jgi:hypothetical protein
MMTLLCKKKPIVAISKNVKTESSNWAEICKEGYGLKKGCFANEGYENNNDPKSIVSYVYGAEALGNNSTDKMFA